VRDCLRAVNEDLRHCMGLAGCSRLADIGPDLLHRRP
jgi:isopentenyl diphosphate isomerase/L-lactate dehydrogenase-like FMN-dependent dehydrogenase